MSLEVQNLGTDCKCVAVGGRKDRGAGVAQVLPQVGGTGPLLQSPRSRGGGHLLGAEACTHGPRG